MSSAPYSVQAATAADPLAIEPVPTLLRRLRAELSAEFDPSRPISISRAPGRLDVMGGIAEYTGSLVVQATLSRAATVALQQRTDREVQIFSFNQLDEHQPFTLRIPLDALAGQPLEKLQQEFSELGRRWAAHLAGCLFMVHQAGIVDLSDPRHRGLNLAILSTVPQNVGAGSSAAAEAATMMNLADHFKVREKLDPARMSILCQQVATRVLGTAAGTTAYAASCFGQTGWLLRMVCQPHELQPLLPLPPGTQIIGINSQVNRRIDGAYVRTRCGTFMAHAIILQQMRKMGQAANRELVGDPMRGYLANLDPEDYKRTFRKHLPENISGQEFLDRFGPTIDTITTVDPAGSYSPQHAADHHVLEARRVQRFVEFLQQASLTTGPPRKLLLDKAGHLMYASHLSYTNDAMLGADECDLLVKLVRERESAGFYGARITAAGSGGTVAVLAEQIASADTAMAEIMDLYENQTGKKPEMTSSDLVAVATE